TATLAGGGSPVSSTLAVSPGAGPFDLTAINAGSLADGPITVSAKFTVSGVDSSTFTGTPATKDTVPPTGTASSLTSPALGGNKTAINGHDLLTYSGSTGEASATLASASLQECSSSNCSAVVGEVPLVVGTDISTPGNGTFSGSVSPWTAYSTGVSPFS